MATLGERCVDHALTYLGHAEVPPGSNESDLIRQWRAPCVRRDTGVLLRLPPSNWCAMFQCAMLEEAIQSDERPPHGYRAGVVEIVADAGDDLNFESTFRPVTAWRLGDWEPLPGDLVIWDRSVRGRPETSWWRHVNRVVRKIDVGELETVGGNENQRVQLGKAMDTDPKLLGFVEYPRAVQPVATPVLSDSEIAQIRAMVALGIDGMIREALYG